MAKRMIKFTPIAASVALTLGLTACGSDNDGNNYVAPPPPVESFSSEDTALFNVEVTGKAVKGAMMNAVVSVSTLDATGEMVAVPFRLAASAEAETFSAEESTQAAADAAVAASILAANPDAVLTNESGRYSVYLENDFSGPVYITVKTSAEGDDSYLRCDAYLGCGTYDEAPAAEDDVNDGDTAIEFGEWYKTDLELSVVKFIPAVEADASGASGVLGDANVARSLRANATFLTTLVSQLLIDAGEGVDAAGIANSSVDVLVQVLGPDTALLLASLLGDVSNGGAVDLTDVDGEEMLDDGILSLTQVASSIQGLADINGNMTKLIAGIKAGKVTGSDDADIAALATALQQAATNTANIFFAIATGEESDIEAALAAAFAVNNPDATDAEKAAFAAQSTGIAKKAKAAKDKAVKNGAASDAGLAKAAEKSKKALEKIGCTDDCTVGDGFYMQLAAKTTAAVTVAEAELVSIQASVTAAQADLVAVQALGGDTVVDADTAVAFANAVELLVNEAAVADLAGESNALFVQSQSLVSVATLLVANSSDYQQILDDADALVVGSSAEIDKVSTFNTELEALEAAAAQALIDFDAEVAAAAALATETNELALAAETAAMTAETASTTALSAAEDAMVDNAENAAEALALADAAIIAASDFAASVDALEVAIAQALAAAEAYLALDADSADAQDLIDSAEAMAVTAAAKAELASEQFATAYALQLTAQDAIAKFEVLVSVKATSESLSTMTVLTSTGGEAVLDAADVLGDVINELADMGNSGEGTSTRQPNWTYAYSLDDLTLMLNNATTGEMISAAASYQGEQLVVAWGATLVGGDATVELMTADTQTNALADCVDFAAGTIDETQIDSCLIFTFDGEVDADTVDDAEIVNTETWNHVTIMDGDSGFTGMLNVTADDATDMGTVTLEGMSGDLDFKVMGTVDASGDEDESMLDVMVKGDAAMGYTLSLMGAESTGYTGDVKAMYNGMMMSFGTATKVTNGLSISYIDGVTMDYTDVDLIDSSK